MCFFFIYKTDPKLTRCHIPHILCVKFEYIGNPERAPPPKGVERVGGKTDDLVRVGLLGQSDQSGSGGIFASLTDPSLPRCIVGSPIDPQRVGPRASPPPKGVCGPDPTPPRVLKQTSVGGRHRCAASWTRQGRCGAAPPSTPSTGTGWRSGVSFRRK